MAPSFGAGTSVARLRLPGLPAAIFEATGLGLRPRCAKVLLLHDHAAGIGNRGKRTSAPFQRGRLTRERLPASHGHIDIDWTEFDCTTGPATHLGGNDGMRHFTAISAADRPPPSSIDIGRPLNSRLALSNLSISSM